MSTKEKLPVPWHNVTLTKSEHANVVAFFSLKHLATGKCYLATTLDLYQITERIASNLRRDRFRNAALQELYNTDPRFELIFVASDTSLPRADQLEAAIALSCKHRIALGDLCLNPRSAKRQYHNRPRLPRERSVQEVVEDPSAPYINSQGGTVRWIPAHLHTLPKALDAA